MVVRVAARCSAHAPLPLPRPRLQLQELSKTSRSRGRPTATRPSEQCERYASSSTRSSAPSSSPSASQWVSQSWTRCCRRMSMSTSASTAAAEAPLRPSMVASVASTAAAGTAATAATAALLLAPLVAELDRMAPRVDIHGSQVCVIETPAEFYETLTKMIRGAKRRIFLSTLYIGTSERELVATLQSALRANPDLTLHILTDALRGTRESPRPSSASLLAPLVAEFGPERVDIRMYHTPNLTGLRKKYIPRRINEGWGLQHMKLYGVDDSILLSGANLSTDYFTNRQDRYHVFASAELADAYWNLQRGVASLSFRIEPVDTATKEEGFNMVWPASNAAPSPLEAPREFVTRATGVLKGLMQPTAANTASPLLTDGKELAEKTKTPDTSVYVLAQMTQLLKPDSSTERPALTHVLKTLSAPQYATASSWTFTAGYFNPAPSLTKLLLATSAQANNTVITAAPQANGFYGSSGVSSMLPDAYTFLAHRFLRAVRAQHRDDAITLKEWRKGTVGEPEGWTYHAKGLWVTLCPQDTKSDSSESAALSVIGSSNYTKRSYSLDLEANALIVTRNVELQKRLSEEQAWLQTHASAVTRDDFAKPERRVRLHVRIAMWIVQAVGGQL